VLEENLKTRRKEKGTRHWHFQVEETPLAVEFFSNINPAASTMHWQ
jgi:hypothetical protein